MPPRLHDRVKVLEPEEYRGCEGSVEVPLWTAGEGERRIGVLIGDQIQWVTAVEILESRVARRATV